MFLLVVIKCFVIEVGLSFGWGKYVGLNGLIFIIDIWGVLVLGNRIFEEYGFIVENVVLLYKEF